MNPYIAALERCILLLSQCRQAEVSLLISNEQMVRMKTRSVHNRVLYNLSHQLADIIAKDVGAERSVVMSQQPKDVGIDSEGDTQFTLRTVIMKATTYVDLLQGLNVLLASALDLVHNEKPEAEPVDDHQYDMFPDGE